MSFTRRVAGQARSGLSSLLDRVASGESPLSHVDERELQAELERRVAARAGAPRAPDDNPRAALAGGRAAARERRRKLAEERARRVHAGRESRRREEKRAQDEAFRRAQEQAYRDARHSGAGASAGARSAGSSGRSAGAGVGGGLRRDPKIARYYKLLDLPYGAEFADVKAAYRKLIRKYHPDLHNGSPQKQKAATELTMQVTQAYNELEAHLTGGPTRRQ